MGTAAQLRTMDLQLKGDIDEVLRYSQWDRKREIHTLVKKTYQSDKPIDDGNWWRIALSTDPQFSDTAKCNLLIVVARLKAFIPQGGPANAYLDMDEEGFLVKKKLAEWSKKQMFFTKAASKKSSHLDVAAPKSSYSIPNYDGYIPIQALDAIQFINEFYEKFTD